MKLTDSQILSTYQLLQEMHSKHLSQHGVNMPRLRSGNQYTKDALVLVFLAQDYPDTKAVSKNDLTEFVREYYPGTADVQQARHLAMQKGWFIVSGTRRDSSIDVVRPGEYKLLSLEEPYPSFIVSRRDGISSSDFEEIKAAYGYRCATCGSREGEPMYQYKGVKTRLMEAHIDPSKPLGSGNIIPQCDNCNRAYRNWWVFDSRGRIVAMADPKVILRSPDEVQFEAYKLLREKFGDMF